MRRGKAHSQKGGLKPWVKKQWCNPGGAQRAVRVLHGGRFGALRRASSIRRGPPSASTSCPTNSFPKNVCPCLQNPAVRSATTIRVQTGRGVRNLFVFFEPKAASWRHIDVRERGARP
jgi:hypothetical protein